MSTANYYSLTASSNKHYSIEQNKIKPQKEQTQQVLLVEDIAVVQEYLSHYVFKNLGYETVIAKDSNEALQLAQESFAVIFLNMGLADSDGIALIQQMRTQQAAQGLYIPIIANLATVQNRTDELIKACFMAGADQVFNGKNCEIEVFSELLESTQRISTHC